MLNTFEISILNLFPLLCTYNYVTLLWMFIFITWYSSSVRDTRQYTWHISVYPYHFFRGFCPASITIWLRPTQFDFTSDKVKLYTRNGSASTPSIRWLSPLNGPSRSELYIPDLSVLLIRFNYSNLLTEGYVHRKTLVLNTFVIVIIGLLYFLSYNTIINFCLSLFCPCYGTYFDAYKSSSRYSLMATTSLRS